MVRYVARGGDHEGVSGVAVSGGQTSSSKNRSAPAGGGRGSQGGQNAGGRGNQRAYGGGGRPSGRPPAGRPVSTKGPKRSGLSPSTIAIGAVGLVVVVVVALIAVKLTGGSSTASSGANGLHPPAVTAASVSVVNAVESVPASVQDAVGSGGSNVLTPPTVKTGQPLLKLGSSSLPAALYIGGEFCPYCAATRWSLLMAFSKFGTFSGVEETTSSPWDVYPATPTFTFVHATYHSQYVNFVPVEYLGQDKNGVNTHGILTPLTSAEQHVYDKYDTVNGSQGVPFVDVGNKYLVTSAPINPQLLDGQTQGQVAAQLTNSKAAVTQAIVGLANDLIAGVCSLDGQQPGAVCSNAGVHKAATALGIS